MPRTYRRARGAVLRLARARSLTVMVGASLVAGSATLALCDFPWESWFTDGFGLVLGGTGLALVLIGLGGHRPDWVDPEG